MRITFYGATSDVTGSMSLVDLPEGKVLIDCGLYQGLAETVKKNSLPLEFDPKEIAAIFLTHAHLDHSGFLPKLVKEGFRGEIYATPATLKLAQIILKDSATIHEEDAENQLYTNHEVTQTISLFKPIEWGVWKTLLGARVCFHEAGHILGASFVEIRTDKTVIFSGDLGRSNDPYMAKPQTCPQADMVIMESTYGGKIRQGDVEKELYSFLIKVSRDKRVGIIASFAVARGQMLLSLIGEFFKRHPEEKMRVVMDGPMMKEANAIYQKMMPEKFSLLSEVEVIENIGEWISLSKKEGPLLIVSSSGMLSGGRIWRHLKNWQDDPRAMLFLPGFQAPGTAGRALSEGFRDVVSPDKTRVHWKGEVITSEAFSSHADQSELVLWLKDIKKETLIYLIHGEEQSKQQLKEKLNSLGYKNVQIPERNEVVKL